MTYRKNYNMGYAYSQRQRRYSNATATGNPSNPTADPGGSATFRIITSANNRAMGDVKLGVAGGSSEDFIRAARTAQQQYSKYTPSTGQTFARGTQLRVTAEPAPGYRFVSWQSAAYIPSAYHQQRSFVVTVDRNMTFIANFEKVPDTYRNVRVNWNAQMGRVVGNGLANGEMSVLAGAYVTLTAVPNEGCHFVCWKGAPISGKTTEEVKFNVNGDYNITAEFAEDNPNSGDNPPGNGDPNDPNNQDTPGGGTGGGGSIIDPTIITTDKGISLKAIVKKYWWVLAIVAYLWYEERGGRK